MSLNFPEKMFVVMRERTKEFEDTKPRCVRSFYNRDVAEKFCQTLQDKSKGEYHYSVYEVGCDWAADDNPGGIQPC